MGVSRTILEDAEFRLKSLDLTENNEIFIDENVPATIKDASFTVKWLGAERQEAFIGNRKLSIQRILEIKVFYRTLKTSAGSKGKLRFAEILDKEEEIITSILATRLGGATSSIRVEDMASSDVTPAEIGGDEWLVNTLQFTIHYEINA